MPGKILLPYDRNKNIRIKKHYEIRRHSKINFMLRKFDSFYKPIVLILVLTSMLSLLYYFFFKLNFFDVTTTQIIGVQKYVSENDLRELLNNKVYGTNIFSIDVNKLQKNLMTTFLGAKGISISRDFPRTIIVEVEERVPLALIFNKVSEDIYMVDEDGYVLGLIEPGNNKLPKIEYDGEIRIGIFINKKMVPIYTQLMLALKDDNVLASSMSFSSSYTSLFVDDSVEVLIGNEKDKRVSISIVANLLKQLTFEGKKPKKIDLRYDKVIVSYD